MPADFEKQSYWHKRFATEKSFEWLTSSSTFLDVLAPYLQPLDRSAAILHIGSGTSDLHNHLRQHGFTDITNIDYEPRALERGQQLERDRFGDVRTKYLVADATRLIESEVALGKYRVAIDKSTADAIACGEGDPVSAMAEGIRRCLTDDGFWISLSFSETRFEHVKDCFDVEIISRLPQPKGRPTDPDVFHYCYLLRPKKQQS